MYFLTLIQVVLVPPTPWCCLLVPCVELRHASGAHQRVAVPRAERVLLHTGANAVGVSSVAPFINDMVLIFKLRCVVISLRRAAEG
jgi:hypothetical protein